MTSLVEYAREELTRAGLFDPDSDYGGELARCVLATIETFSSYRHSGLSVHLAAEIFRRLVDYEPLTPLTYEPEEWIDQSEPSGRPLWQNRRKFDVFSDDGGGTWYSLDGTTGEGWRSDLSVDEGR